MNVASSDGFISDAAAARARSARIFERFLQTCHERPEATAIVHPRGRWTYAQLERASRALAIQLLDLPSDNTIVALYSHRCGELPVAMLACLRAGLAFAVLDAGYPIERLRKLVEVLRPGRMLTIGEPRQGDALADVTRARARLHLDAGAIDRSLVGEDRHDVRLDRTTSDAIAYLLFTSGTTGVPKCVATPHAPLVHFVDWYERTFEAVPGCRFAMLSGLGHDPVLRDIFVPLSLGAELHVPSQAQVLDPDKLYTWLAETGVTHVHVTPQLCRILCAGRRDRRPLEALRFVFSGGDSLRTRQADAVLAAAPRAEVVNFYGTTETPQAMAFHRYRRDVDGALDVVPVGRGIDDVELLVLDDQLEPAGIDVQGQIAIRTRFLSAGYHADDALTSARFKVDPRGGDDAIRLYLTGDLGRMRPDGTVLVEGRSDDQVKIRGFRVELGEVVHHLEQMPGVDGAIVLAERTPDGEMRLAAYLVPVGGDRPDEAATSAIKEVMAASLPAYLVPARFVWVERFPLLPNGKIDRAAIAALGARAADEDGARTWSPPASDIEAAIAAEWQALLGVRRIDSSCTFVELGGDSLSFISASVHLETVLGVLPESWEKLPIRELALHKRERRSRWTRLDASILVRALSIIAVVAGHFSLPNIVGSVRALFVVSGMSFGKYVVPRVLQTDRVMPVMRLLLKIAIPTVLYSVFVNLVYGLPQWPGMLMVNNLVSPDSHVSGIGFWFIDVLVQCLAVLAAILSVRRARALVSRQPFRFALTVTILLAGVALVAPYLWNTSPLHDRVPQAYLCEICLGWAVVHADSRRRKLAVVAATMLTFLPIAWQLQDLLLLPFAATLFLLRWNRITLPRRLGRAAQLVAGASLFMYLMDHQIGVVLGKVGLGAHPVVMLLVVVAAGIAAQRVWEPMSALALQRLRRLLPNTTSRANAIGANELDASDVLQPQPPGWLDTPPSPASPSPAVVSPPVG